jgi:hypothetical protein
MPTDDEEWKARWMWHTEFRRSTRQMSAVQPRDVPMNEGQVDDENANKKEGVHNNTSLREKYFRPANPFETSRIAVGWGQAETTCKEQSLVQ